MLKILGDINFSDWYFDTGYGVGSSIYSGKNPFEYLNFIEDDFWLGNFECVCANIDDDHSPFVIKPTILKSIPHLNFYGIANNHVMQAGEDAYHQTIKFCKDNGILFAGSKGKKFAKFEHQGEKVGIIVFSQRPDNFYDTPCYWHLPEYEDIHSELLKIQDCDYKIAYIHWGYEFMNYPNIDQKLLGHWLVDNGVDLVVGMHPHVAQGMELYKDKPIYYSLGNSVFHMNWDATKYGLLLTVDLCSRNVTYNYIKIDQMGFPHIVSNVPNNFSIDYLNSLIGISEENEKYFFKVFQMLSQYRAANRRGIFKDILLGKSPYARQIISDFIKRSLKKT